jgi:hypothetical protein
MPATPASSTFATEPTPSLSHTNEASWCPASTTRNQPTHNKQKADSKSVSRALDIETSIWVNHPGHMAPMW